jgi:hypothetical protein
VEELTEIIKYRKENVRGRDVKIFIIEHFLFNNLFETSIAYSKRHDLENYNDVKTFKYVKNIQKEILKGEFEDAILFCRENRNLLRSFYLNEYGNKLWCSELENMFKVQTYVELCRADKKKEALAYLRSTFGKDQKVVKPYLPLLVCRKVFFTDHYSLNNYERLSLLFRRSVLAIHGQPMSSRLTKRIEYGIVAFKTKVCTYKINPECPTCLSFIRSLRDRLPFARIGNSVLLCKGSGLEMNERNQPYAFESGYVYSEEYIRRLDYNYICKETGRACSRAPKICYFV